MSNLQEIKKAISFFPKKNVVLLHCISCYPTKENDANLINIKTLKDKFGLEVGYSDHTTGIDAAANSIFFGATIIEKHFMPKKLNLLEILNFLLTKKIKKLVLKIKQNYAMVGKSG